MSYLFFLGRSHELAEAELSVFFPLLKRINDAVFQVEQDSFTSNNQTIFTGESIRVLGGTVKIAQILGVESDLEPMTLVKYFLNDAKDRITFGFSTYEGVPNVTQRVYQEVKDVLEKEGRKVRFILPKEHSVLSGVAVAKQDVSEINIVKDQNKFLISKTIAIQEFEEWANRDYNRPHWDSKEGMLPPKVARMVVNIALGVNASGKTLLDPFCGMGTIPGEAILRGAIAIGSDYSKDAVGKAKKNSIWLRSHDTKLPPITYFVSDATHISDVIRKETIDAIVTEPFMGSPNLGLGKITDTKEIKNIIKGLEKLYIGCLREWHALLKPHGAVVIALPDIILANTKYSVKNIIDRCETLGYTMQDGPLAYSRPQAVVRRMFYKLIKRQRDKET
jgi:tRNA G10  N-methylase Trm11